MAEIPILGEHVPIPTDEYVKLKQLLDKARNVGIEASVAGLRLAKATSYAMEKAAEADSYENAINDSIKSIVLKAGVSAEQFDGIDMEKGVINLRKESVQVG